MGNVNDKLEYIAGTKSAIRAAIEAQGGIVSNEDTFRSYAAKILGLLHRFFYVYKDRVEADSGVINSERISSDIIRVYEANGLYDSILFAWFGGAGSKKRESTIYSYFTKLYSLFGTNDATQTTEASQPFVSGNIAPNENEGICNPFGNTRSLSHADITVTGTYMVVKLQRLKTSGKIVFNYTEHASGTLNTMLTDGDLFAYLVYNKALSAGEKTEIEAVLRPIYPEIPSVTIGTQTWATSNFDAVATPQGTVIKEMQAAANVDLTPSFNFSTGWTNVGGGSVTDADTFTSSSSGGINKSISNLPIGTWIKYTIAGTTNATSTGLFTGGGQNLSGNQIGTFSKSGYTMLTVATTGIYLRNEGAGVTDVTALSFQVVGWADSQNLYDAIYAQTTGTATEKEYAALKAAAMWRYPNNDSTIGSWAKKLYNRFAIRLMKWDIDLFNTANPTALWGWKPATRAQLTTLSTIGGNAAKVAGTSYWTTANGTNASGLTALGTGYIDAAGAYQSNKGTTGIMAVDADFVRQIVDGDDTFAEVAITTEGYPIRLIKD